jgi:cellobiose phosphorylase
MIAGRYAPRYGEAKNSWLTGTAAWTFVSVSQALLGITPDYDGLKVNPCVPAELKTYTVNRLFRGAQYTITVHNEGRSKREMTVDGKAVNGNIVPFANGKTHYQVEVFI